MSNVSKFILLSFLESHPPADEWVKSCVGPRVSRTTLTVQSLFIIPVIGMGDISGQFAVGPIRLPSRQTTQARTAREERSLVVTYCRRKGTAMKEPAFGASNPPDYRQI
jgi:hypothetical protein